MSGINCARCFFNCINPYCAIISGGVSGTVRIYGVSIFIFHKHIEFGYTVEKNNRWNTLQIHISRWWASALQRLPSFLIKCTLDPHKILLLIPSDTPTNLIHLPIPGIILIPIDGFKMFVMKVNHNTDMAPVVVRAAIDEQAVILLTIEIPKYDQYCISDICKFAGRSAAHHITKKPARGRFRMAGFGLNAIELDKGREGRQAFV